VWDLWRFSTFNASAARQTGDKFAHAKATIPIRPQKEVSVPGVDIDLVAVIGSPTPWGLLMLSGEYGLP
jgi:hypothetical protein